MNAVAVHEQKGVATVRYLVLPAVRVALVGVAAVLTWLIVGLAVPGEEGDWAAFPPIPLLSAVAILPVNLVCLVLVRRALHRDGLRARDLIGFSRARLGRDILWGLLWLLVLYLPFALTVMGVMYLLHGADLFERFETVFVDPAAVPALDQLALVVLAVFAVVTFAPVNAPVEELVYRGHAQSGLARRWPAFLAILAPSILFGLQHAFYAPTPGAVLVYVCAFTVWGVGSGLIVWKQGRLMPVIIAHFLVNLFTSAPALGLAFAPIGAP